MAARVSKEHKELFRAFIEVLRTSEFLGMSRDDLADLAEEVDRLVQEKIALPKQTRQPKAKSEEEKPANLPEAPKKKDKSKKSDSEEAVEEVTLVEGRRYEATGNAKLGSAILEFTGETREKEGATQGKFLVADQGDGSIPVGKRVFLPVTVVSPTRRRIKKAA